MSQAAETNTPKPNRRGFLFYGSAVVAAAGLAKVALPSGPDPVYQAIEAYRAASATIEAYYGDDDREWNRLEDIRDEALRVLSRTKPTTKDGAHAMMAEVFMHEAGGDIVNIAASPISAAIGTLLAAWPA